MIVQPLSAVSAAALDDVFEEETQCWLSQLYWDYGPAVQLIRRHVASRSLSGFVLKQDSRVVGYCYYVVSGKMGYLGNTFVKRASASDESYAALLSHGLSTLQGSRAIERIESQVFAFNWDVRPVFVDHGFIALGRYFMTMSLPVPSLCDDDGQGEHRILPWDPGYLLPAAEVIFDSYAQSPDYRMCRDYQSREGCLRFLKNLIDNPGCGRFSPEMSMVAADSSGRLCGLLVASVISRGTGMIPQISVRRDSQDKGVGTRLLSRYFALAQQAGLERVTLSVSEQNQRAHALYQRLGFREARSFYAFVWTRPV
jgi:ribosomal protein S18 acetylase RimI-like enzyme